MLLIKGAIGVISMCGTNLFEACIANKRAILIGNAEYSALSYVEKYDKYITKFENHDNNIAKSNNILKYIQTLHLLGVDIDQFYLLYAKYQQSNFNQTEYLTEVIKLKSMFDSFISMSNVDVQS